MGSSGAAVAKIRASVLVMLWNKSAFNLWGFRKPVIMGIKKSL
jgi:hypothetical protein